MPKIVDHDKKREEIALKAASIFLEHGYKDLGMRQLCSHLSMSKSAVYHYFKSKDEIFVASTEAMFSSDSMILNGCPHVEHASQNEKLENFIQIMNLLAPRHFQETKLVMEYIDVIGLENIPQDTCMRTANEKYQSLLANYVDAEQTEQLYAILLGLLSQQLLLGRPLSKDYISGLIQRHIG
ncbi:TetR family transcriptional regulator [Marinomonas sp. S3726]|jgi:AcrR family transcriptional regulator|uniref:TetR/AcrR family transcriptional regulator n=1 Tax=Marinomonas sp. S3726 TaxID=579484 RepID=UPI0005FA48C9|nr:TetR/AcrR family transcriptional regulator [Marinomonas sp. S3726]KJZ14873.1 TetR family transcriptional regulator [Marinomonas sp. S3726]